MSVLRKLMKRSQTIVDFNQARRDAWVASRARSLQAASLVLDVGAGTGRYRSLFTHCTYRAHDFAQYKGTAEGLLADQWPYAPLDYVADATAIPVADSSFDAVLCTEVLEHVPEPIAVIREISRTLRPGGRVFITAPLGSGLHQQPYHFYGGYTPHFYRKFLSEAGFRIISIEPNGGFFRHLLQEVHRAGVIIVRQPGRRRYYPFKVVVAVLFCVLAPIWLERLDKRLPIEEFTVGYHVEAVRE